jgi:hypothetical protein
MRPETTSRFTDHGPPLQSVRRVPVTGLSAVLLAVFLPRKLRSKYNWRKTPLASENFDSQDRNLCALAASSQTSSGGCQNGRLISTAMVAESAPTFRSAAVFMSASSRHARLHAGHMRRAEGTAAPRHDAIRRPCSFFPQGWRRCSNWRSRSYSIPPNPSGRALRSGCGQWKHDRRRLTCEAAVQSPNILDPDQ